MAADRKINREQQRICALLRPCDESGQSILEFLLVLPVLLGFAFLMIRVNTVIQVSIVNQQYSREQAFLIAGNGAEYPRRPGVIQILATAKYNQLLLGVSDNSPPDDDGGGGFHPVATTVQISRKNQLGNNDDKTEPTQRGIVRVRNTITMCLPQIAVGDQPLYPGEGKKPVTATSPANIGDASKLDYCSSPQEYTL